MNGFSDSHSGISGERDRSPKERNPTEVELGIARALGYAQAACFDMQNEQEMASDLANLFKIILSNKTKGKYPRVVLKKERKPGIVLYKSSIKMLPR